MLREAKWFQNHWLGGLFLFLVNTFLFSAVLFAVYLLGLLNIPLVHIIIMLSGVLVSFFAWVQINQAWQGRKQNRLKMGFTGSSFYLLLTAAFVYGLLTLQPSYPGEDTFMAAIGLIFGLIVTCFAFAACLTYTAFEQRNIK